MMPGPRAAFMTSLLQSRAAKNVTADAVARIPAGADGSELRENLRGTDIGRRLGESTFQGRQERDGFLWEYLDAQFSLLEESPFVPPGAVEFGRVYVRKFDLVNIKSRLRGIAAGQASPMIPVGILRRRGLLDDFAEADSVEDMGEILRLAGLSEFAAELPAAEGAPGMPETTPLDAAFHHVLAATARGLAGGTVLAHSCGVMLDYANLSLLLRAVAGEWGAAAEKQFIPPGYLLSEQDFKEALSAGAKDVAKRIEYPAYRSLAEEAAAGPPAAVDEVVARHRFEHLRGLLAAQVAPPCVAAWFLVSKEAEVRNIRLLLKAAEDGLSFETARRCLVL